MEIGVLDPQWQVYFMDQPIENIQSKFRRGKEIHPAAMSGVNDVDENKTSPDMEINREIARPFQYGPVLYGITRFYALFLYTHSTLSSCSFTSRLIFPILSDQNWSGYNSCIQIQSHPSLESLEHVKTIRERLLKQQLGLWLPRGPTRNVLPPSLDLTSPLSGILGKS